MKKRILLIIALAALALTDSRAQLASTASLRFEVTVAQGLISSPQNGRLFVIASRASSPEPRLGVGETGLDAPPMFARDVNNFAPGVAGVIDERAIAFPIEDLAHLPAGDYYVQALFDSNIDLKSVNAPGNLYSGVQKMRLDPARGQSVKIELTNKLPPEELPAETEYVKYVKIQSNLLTSFHGRPIYLRAGVILPRDFNKEVSRKYPLRVEIGGYGSRFTNAQRMMAEASDKTLRATAPPAECRHPSIRERTASLRYHCSYAEP